MKIEKEKAMKIGKIVLTTILVIFLGISAWKELANESFEKAKDWLINRSEEKAELQKITTPQAFFGTETYDIRSRTVFKVSYKKPKIQTPFWAILEKEVGNVNRIIDHPLIDDLSWNKIENEKYTIFQRNNDFNSVDTFFTSTQTSEDILIEDFLESESEVINNAEYLTVAENLDGINFIVMNYRQEYMEGDLSVYETVIDATDAKVDNDRIFWGIIMPGVSEDNPIELKIDIDFSQPGNIIYEE